MRNCFVCGSEKHRHYCYWKSYEYLECEQCGLVSVSEVPKKEEIYKAYDGGTWKALRRKLVSPFRRFEQFNNFEYSMNRGAEIFSKAVPHLDIPSQDQKRMLDIGCNKGFLLAQGVEAGYEVYGIEIVEVLMDQFKRKYPAFADNIYAADFSEAQTNFADESFHLITAIDVIEHFQQPVADMEHVFRVLKPGGVFLVQTPDTNSQLARAQKEKWEAIKAYEHLQLFNPNNLERFALKLGYQSVEVFEPVDKGIGNLMAVLKK